MATPRYVSPTNIWPTATGEVVAFVRDPAKFKLNEYVQLVNAPDPVGFYYLLDRDRPIRVVSDAEFAFEDGDEAPTGNTNKGNFSLEEFRCFRRAIPYTVGEEAQEAHKRSGGFDPALFEERSCASQAMTLRTKRILAILDDSTQYPTANTSDATTLGGGKWDAGTSTAPYFRQGILKAAQAVHLQTNGSVQLSDMVLILSPAAAIVISKSQEMYDYLKSSPFAYPNIKGELANPNELWGLPSHVGGIKIIIEDTMSVTTRPLAAGTAGTRAYLKNDDIGVIVSRPGSLDAPYGTRSYSTIQLFYHKYEMAVERRVDSWNKRIDGRVLDYYVPKLVAAPAAYLASDILT